MQDPPAPPLDPSGAWRCGDVGLCQLLFELVCECGVALTTHLAIGEFDRALMFIFALLIGALLATVAEAERLVAVLSGQVLHCSGGEGVIGRFCNRRNDPLSFAVFSLFPKSFATFVLRCYRLGSQLLQCVQIRPGFCDFTQCFVQASTFGVQCGQLRPYFCGQLEAAPVCAPLAILSRVRGFALRDSVLACQMHGGCGGVLLRRWRWRC